MLASTVNSSKARLIWIAVAGFVLWSVYLTVPKSVYQGQAAESSTYHLIKEKPSSYRQDGQGFLPIEKAEAVCEERGLKPIPNRDTHRKVYDLFLVGTEMDWVEIRLNELSPYVDYFVVVESRFTFTNNSKPLYFKRNYAKFAKFAPQIIYHVLEDDAVRNSVAWDREHYSRNAMMDQVFPRLLGAQAPQMGDVILVSDVDEIPRPETVTMLRNCDFPQRVTLSSRAYLYSYEWHLNGNDWHHPQATYWQGFGNTVRPESLRMDGTSMSFANASWHCTTCFSTVAEFVKKITSFSHAELNQEKFKIPSEIVRRVRNGLDIFDRGDMTYEKIENNPDVPKYLDQHRDRFPYLLDRDPFNANFIDYGHSGMEEYGDSNEGLDAATGA